MRRGPLVLIATGILAMGAGTAGLVLVRTAATPALLSDARPAPATSSSPPSALPSAAPSIASPTSAIPPARIAGASLPVGPPVARLSIPRIGIHHAPVYDRGLDRNGTMLIAPGYAITHYSFSSPFGAGNAVIYGHDDIQGDIFGHLYDLVAGDVVQVTVGNMTQTYRVSGHQIVAPTAVSVLAPTADARLTIITCWPFNVDTKRWIVTAVPA